MTDILIINPSYYLKRENKLNLAFYRELDIIQPLGICYIAASCQNAGLTVKIIDMEAEGTTLPQLKEKILKIKPKVIGLTCPTPLIKNVITIMEMIKKEHPVPIIIGGPHAIVEPKSLTRVPHVDYIIKGEAETLFPELVKCIIQNKDKKHIPNLLYRENGEIVETKTEKDLIPDLNVLPFPARELLNNKLYFNVFTKGNTCTSIITSRGCPYTCVFCNPMYKTVRKRSVESVIKEIKEVKEKLNIHYFEFFDETFNLNKKWVVEFCDKIAEEKLDFHWRVRCRPDFIDDEVAAAFKKGHCETVSMGMESGNEETLKFFNKQYKVAQIESAVKSLQKYGIKIHGYFILGSPTETKEQMLNTIKFAIKTGIDYASFTILAPIPGTDLYPLAVKEGWYEDQDPFDYTEHSGYISATLKHPTMTEKEILDVHALAYKKFYFRPKGVKSLVRLTSPRIALRALQRIK